MLFTNMTSAAGAAGRYLGQTLRLMVGVPDYETYVCLLYTSDAADE